MSSFSYARRPLQVQSHYLDRESMRTAEDGPRMKHQIYQKASIKVYDLWQSFQLMCQWIVQKPQQQGDVKEMLASLKQLCAVRI